MSMMPVTSAFASTYQGKVDIISVSSLFQGQMSIPISASERYLLAQHEITTNLDEICHVAQRVLKVNGRLTMVLVRSLLDIIETMKRYNLAPKRISLSIQRWPRGEYVIDWGDPRMAHWMVLKFCLLSLF